MAKKVISSQQKSLLISYLEEHPQLVKQKHGNQYTNADSAKLWQQLTEKLNAIPGAIKGWKGWRKTWSDLKTRTKRKLSENKKQNNKTGGGPHTGDIIDGEDDKILEINGGDILITGLDVPEVGLPIPINPQPDTDPEIKTENENLDTSIGDNSYTAQEESKENEDVIALPQKMVEKTRTLISKSFVLKAARPHAKVGVSRNRPRQATNRAVFDLIKVKEATNTIRENYYSRKLEIMEESLQIQKENLEVQKRIAKGIEICLESN